MLSPSHMSQTIQQSCRAGHCLDHVAAQVLCSRRQTVLVCATSSSHIYLSKVTHTISVMLPQARTTPPSAIRSSSLEYTDYSNDTPFWWCSCIEVASSNIKWSKCQQLSMCYSGLAWMLLALYSVYGVPQSSDRYVSFWLPDPAEASLQVFLSQKLEAAWYAIVVAKHALRHAVVT